MSHYTPDRLIELQKAATEALNESLGGLTDEVMAGEILRREWTIKDVLSHLAGWEKELRGEALHLASTSGGSFSYRIDPEGGWRAWNHMQAEQRRGRSVLEIRLELVAEERITLAALKSLDPAALDVAGDYPWGDSGTVEQLFLTIAGHKAGHARTILEWRRTAT